MNDVAAVDATGTDSGDTGNALAAMIFLAHSGDNTIHRYSIEPGKDPFHDATIPTTGSEGLTLSASGELFVAAINGSVLRFTTALTIPTANGTLQNLGITEPEELAFVDDELWVPSTSYAGLATASQITRIAFTTSGVGSVAGVVQAPGIVAASRGILWHAASRTLYLTDCCSVSKIQPYKVASDKTVTALAGASGGNINNPHGMVITPWGELLVSSANNDQVLRFKIDAQGALTANGAITGNGLSTPAGLAWAPWGELIVVNSGTGSLSRFTFSAAPSYAPQAAGNYLTGLNSTGQLNWILLVPAPPSR